MKMESNGKGINHLILFLVFVELAGCAPKVYVLDRHTVMEEEAAGDWPVLEDLNTPALAQPGATPFARDDEEESITANRKILNGEMVGDKSNK